MNYRRRRFLAGLAALGAAAVASRGRSLAQVAAGPTGPAPRPVPHRIDVHCHFSAPGFIAAIKARNTGQLPLMNWSVARTLEDMDRDGVATSIVSTSEPGVWFGDNEAARRLARECNEYGARLMADYPGRLGMFATLPLPDVDGALREIEYAFDTLRADGACFLSSYQGKYLGDPAFAPVMAELNRRRAVVYTHPARAECCVNLLPEGRALGITLSTETTLTIASVLFSGTAARFPDIRFIWSHGGGTMPYITGRFGVNANAKTPELPNGVLYEIQKFYYDTAQAFNEYTLPTFTKLVPLPHMLFGTDYPFTRAETVAQGLAKFGFSPAAQRAIERDNALELFPRLRQAVA
ncbi:MAG: amidohydrolase [Acidobacteria bacterium]|nr:amidohydrolase [Acidobacteriota bacterium]